ncbi:MAG: hypothetical protein DI582_03675 [Azospirillum brasilense]|nr:MAG: hypothetical protein DI582_03675 [Azospirillum brasilense]
MSTRPTYDTLFAAAHAGIAAVPIGGEPWLANLEAAMEPCAPNSLHVMRTVHAQVDGLAQAAIMETRGINCARQVEAHYENLKGALSHAYLMAPEVARPHLIDPGNDAQWQVFAAALEAAPRQQLENADYRHTHESMAARIVASRAGNNDQRSVGC